MPALFRDRREAGRQLAEALQREEGVRRQRTVVLALPRGGVPVGYEVSVGLGARLAVFLVRKLGVPAHRELAMGAIASGGVRVLNDEVVTMLRIPAHAIEEVAAEEEAELARREQQYGAHGIPHLDGARALLVDDGLATGSTMRAAVRAVRKLGPERIVVAVPVAAPETCEQLSDEADRVVCLHTPEPFHAVGLWYEDFGQTTDAEVRALLDTAAAMQPTNQ